MAIVRMKRLYVVGNQEVKDELLRALTKLGCVEFEIPDISQIKSNLLSNDTYDISEAADARNEIAKAINILSIHAPSKKKMFSQKTELEEKALFERDFTNTINTATRINFYKNEIHKIAAEKQRIEGVIASLEPWTNVDVPLDFKGSREYSAEFASCPSTVSLDKMKDDINNNELPLEVFESSSDREQRYLFIIYYRKSFDDVWEFLKRYNVLRVSLKGESGTAKENIESLRKELAALASKADSCMDGIASLSDTRDDLEFCYDRLLVDETRQKLRENLVVTPATFSFAGWCPAEEELQVTSELTNYGCAYKFEEPEYDEDDENSQPPVAFKSSKFFEQFNVITELYGMPKYSSLIDPTPIMAPFFLLFFGIMMADVGYGVIFSLLSAIVLKKLKPSGIAKNLLSILFYGGISMIFWGIMFGSWFADAFAHITKMITGTPQPIPPLLFDPMNEPLIMLILSCGLGLVHIMVGMGISAWRQIKKGRWFDAVCDVGFWYLIFIGLIVGLVISPVGYYIAVAGVIGIFIFGGRHKSNFIGKITGGLSDLYGVTGYLSDILSYSRLLALGLTTSVVGSVMNIMGTLIGPSAIGFIMFLVVFLIGHTFNIIINTLGAAVHALRLQYVEFFGKFYESGGRAFKPAFNKTKYIRLK